MACVAGKYYDVDEQKCKYCPVGTYTDTPGRLGCSACPRGKTTAGVGTHNKTDCRGKLSFEILIDYLAGLTCFDHKLSEP